MPNYDIKEERRIAAGKPQSSSSGTTTIFPRDVFTKVMDEYGQPTPVWKWNDPMTQAATSGLENYYASGGAPSGQGTYSDLMALRLGIQQAGGGAGVASPTTSGSGSGASSRMAILKAILDEYQKQSGENVKTIDDTSKRVLDALKAQQNPYANLSMAPAPAVVDPMSAYLQAVGAPTSGVDALSQMLGAQNTATGNAFGNLAQLLGASHTSAQQSRLADIEAARAGAQQDLAQNQRSTLLKLIELYGGK